MSSVAARPLPAPRAVSRTPARARTLKLRLVLFAAFAAFAALPWAMLVTDPSVAAVAATVAAATACAAALELLGRTPLARRAVLPLAAAVVLVALAAGLVANGIAPRLLLPSGWTELADNLERALIAVQGIDWAYDGPDEWIRATVVLGAPVLLTVAAAIAFWPASPKVRPLLHDGATAVLIATYAIAATTRDPGRPLLFGAVLLVLIAAWLWLPRLAERERAVGAGALALVAVLALPVAAALDTDGPWVDYRSWSFGGDAGVAFSWDHAYGPLDWPRQGTTLLKIRSEQPHYWKAETLNDFDGVRWRRDAADDTRPLDAELPFETGAAAERGTWSYGRPNLDWEHEVEVTVRSLSTDLLIGAGLTHEIRGAAAVTAADGTTRLLGDPLERGDSYTINAYDPAPNALQMERAPEGYPAWAERYTRIAVPSSATGGAGVPLNVPLRDSRATKEAGERADRLLSRSAYARTYALAQSLTAGSPSAYDAVEIVERHLRQTYAYSEQVPEHAYPLESFLTEDRRGYCQQFSGAMALMLRMVGIPARVAAGFSPGTFNRKTGQYRVRDLDAHSWVEVYFNGIGWVPFDPTPGVAAASSQAAGTPATVPSGEEGDAGQVTQDTSEPAPAEPDAPEDQGPAGSAGGSSGSEATADGGAGRVVLAVALGFAAVALAGAMALAIRVRQRRALGREQLADAAIAELRGALERVGWDVSPATTLLSIERRLTREAGPVAGAYAHALRSFRFDPQGGEPPGPVERRALRRALASRLGRLGRLRALIALPPGGPT